MDSDGWGMKEGIIDLVIRFSEFILKEIVQLTIVQNQVDGGKYVENHPHACRRQDCHEKQRMYEKNTKEGKMG